MTRDMRGERAGPVEKQEEACCRSKAPAVHAEGPSNWCLEHTRNANLNTNESSSDSLNLGSESIIKMPKCKAIACKEGTCRALNDAWHSKQMDACKPDEQPHYMLTWRQRT
jgi:hypothetical protein